MHYNNLNEAIDVLRKIKVSETGKLIAKYVSPDGMSETEIDEIVAKAEEEGFVIDPSDDGVIIPLYFSKASCPMYYWRKFDIDDDIARLESYLER